MATENSSTKYTPWPCDNGTVDVCENGEVVFQNLPAPVAQMVVEHDGLVAALKWIADNSCASSFCGAERVASAALAKVQA